MTARDVGVAVQVAGIDVKAVAVDRLSIVWGRESLDEQPDASTLELTLDVTKAGWSTDTLPVQLGAVCRVYAVLGSDQRIVFNGYLDEPRLYYDPSTEHVHLKVTADDPLADLAQIYVGDEPWPAEPAKTRANQIMTVIGQNLVAGAHWYHSGETEFPESLWEVQARDVDRQPALALLQELAESTDTAVYALPASYLPDDALTQDQCVIGFHSLSLDHPGYEFVEIAGVFTSQLTTAGAELELSADHLMPDVEYRRSRSLIYSDLVVEYEPTPGVTAEITRAPATALGGVVRRRRIETKLTSSTNATELLDRQVRRNRPTWHTDALVWDANDGGTDADLLVLLDGALRVGVSVRLLDSPAWIPTEAQFVYVEGGELEYIADDRDRGDANVGRWIVGMRIVPSTGLGTGITYAQALANHPTMTYTNIDPNISYQDALSIGV